MGILNLREFDQLKELESMYNKISVNFDPDFEAKVMNLVDVEGVIPKKKTKERSRTRSSKREQEAYIDDTA